MSSSVRSRDVEAPAGQPGNATTTTVRPRSRRPWWRRRPVKRSFIWLHRWLSLTLGLLLLAVTTSGAIVLYEPQLNRLQHPAGYASESDASEREQDVRGQIPLAQAYDLVHEHDPDFQPDSVHYSYGTVVADDYESGRRVTLDALDGQLLADGDTTADVGGVVEWVMDLSYNVHLCGLTCEDMPGYQAWLVAEVPVSGWLGFDGAPITWGGLLLGLAALTLLFLALSGVWLWWPGVKKWWHGVRIRWSKGRYARDFDLHQVIGMVTVPFLLVWALTGAGYELGFVTKGWFAALPGEEPAAVELVSVPPDGDPPPDLDFAEVIAAAARELGTTEAPTGVELPAADDPAATYLVYFADGVDPWALGDYPGDAGVSVDRYSGDAAVTFGGPGRPLSAQLWNEWNFQAHSGFVVGPWWRLIWLAFGLMPLLLAVTGLSTWLYKRKVRKTRRTATLARATESTTSTPEPTTEPTAEPLLEPASAQRWSAPVSSRRVDPAVP